MHQIALTAQGKDSILDVVTSSTPEGEVEVLYAPKQGVTFHFFSSQSPCETTQPWAKMTLMNILPLGGDASIFPVSVEEASRGASCTAGKRRNEARDSGIKKRKMDELRQDNKLAEPYISLLRMLYLVLERPVLGKTVLQWWMIFIVQEPSV